MKKKSVNLRGSKTNLKKKKKKVGQAKEFSLAPVGYETVPKNN